MPTRDLTTTVRVGAEFNVVVRRVVTTYANVPPPPPPPLPPQIASYPARTAEGGDAGRAQTTAKTSPRTDVVKQKIWRYIRSASHVNFPVATATTSLVLGENTLAILKWRFPNIGSHQPLVSSPVERYIQYVAGRVDGLGGNASQIPPSLSGAPVGIVEQSGPCQETVGFVGKVAEVTYDCFGDFVGFVLSDCCKLQEFASRERGLSEIILRAFRERLRLAVIVARGSNKILKILIVE